IAPLPDGRGRRRDTAILVAAPRTPLQSAPGDSPEPEVTVDLQCPACGTSFAPQQLGQPQACPHCGERLGRLAQLDQCLRRWYAPRRWRVDIQQPNVYFLIEKLWTASGQGERLYQAISPRYTNFDIFRHMVTRKIAAGVEEGWVGLSFPEDPLAEDPVYRLEFGDPSASPARSSACS